MKAKCTNLVHMIQVNYNCAIFGIVTMADLYDVAGWRVQMRPDR